MKNRLFAAIIVTACAAWPQTADDLQGIKGANYLQLSPSGEAIAYTSGDGIWVVSAKPESAPRRIAAGTLPVWSPDGTSLAYYNGSAGAQQLNIVELESGKSKAITALAGGINPDRRTRMTGWIGDPQRFSWSPDGQKVVFASQVAVTGTRPGDGAQPNGIASDNTPGAPLVLTTKTPASWTLSGIFTSAFGPAAKVDPGKPVPLPREMVNQLFVTDLARGVTEQLTHDDAIYFNPEWSHDGHSVLCASTGGGNPGNGPSNLYLIDAATGRKKALTAGAGDKRIPRWSPDGKWIAYIGGDHYAMQSVFLVPSEGGEPVNVASKVDRYITQFEWMPDSRSIAVLDWDGVDWPILRVTVPAGDAASITGMGAAMRPFFSAAGAAVAWIQNDGTHPGVIFTQHAGGASPSITVDLNPQARTWKLGEQEAIRWRNKRGDELEGVLVKPVGYQPGRRYPLIVDAYPAQPNGFKGSLMMGNQMWAADGYVVFWPNARAPHVWMNAYKDQAFNQAARGPNGWDVTVDDVLSGVDELIRLGIVDGARMGLHGFSNGGGIVNYLITRTNRFQCAVSVAGVYPDWILPSLLHTTTTIPTFEGGVSPWDDPEAYVKLSAVFHLKTVTTPMLLADGDDDGDFLLGMIELYNSLRWLGKDVTFLRYPGQGHGFSGPSLADFRQRELAFFERYLKPR